MTGVLNKKGKLAQTYPGRTPREHEGGDWRDVSISQGVPRNQQKLRERHGADFLSPPSEGTNLSTA